ncbi:polysaccharide deacetylase [Amycolatopsis acidicola]|uniref:Polysaccharide deacetylase n=1 Tax=Amycolatopsis acidicola TaxID=2596893 RepID=A0A5N0VNS6_9PSEU|nr:polysaccharide deacetylase [Amycolatopsis acidicola]KAA9166442.1 polysaccharide deacetylase [Amycolatopsis acidicola]
MTTPVLLTFDMDAELLWTARDPEGAGKPVWVSQGHYGPNVGLPRILRLLKKYGIAASFFVPGQVVERYPAAIESILDAGFVIEHHSHTHTWSDNLSRDQEAEEFGLAAEAIVKATGRAPKGWRSPAAELTPHSVSLLEEHGMIFSSNLFDADSVHLLDDRERGTDIVEIPFAWALVDTPVFMYTNRVAGRVMSAPSAVLETWTREFDGLVEEEGTHFMIGMHPQFIGRSSRLWVLEQTIKHALASGRAEFLSCADYAERVRPGLLAAKDAR